MSSEIDTEELKEAMLALRVRPSLKAALKVRADAAERKLADYVARVLTAHVESTPVHPAEGAKAKRRQS